MRWVRQHGDSELLNSSHSHFKNGHALNRHLEFLQTISSKPYVLLGKALMGGISQLSQMLKHYTLLQTMAMHLTAFIEFFKQHL